MDDNKHTTTTKLSLFFFHFSFQNYNVALALIFKMLAKMIWMKNVRQFTDRRGAAGRHFFTINFILHCFCSGICQYWWKSIKNIHKKSVLTHCCRGQALNMCCEWGHGRARRAIIGNTKSLISSCILWFLFSIIIKLISYDLIYIYNYRQWYLTLQQNWDKVW